MAPLSAALAPVLTAERRAALADAWRALWWSRALVWLAGIAALLVLGPHERNRVAFDPGGLTEPFGAFGDLLVAPAARWDSVWYLVIADGGYGGGDREAFFPLYPWLAGAVGFALGSSLVGGLLVSLACALAALYLLRRLAALEVGEEAARTTVWLCALFPMSFFLSAVYSEALFLALAVGAFYAARRDRWAWAGALGALAAMTRSAGVLLLVPLAVLYLWGPREGPPLRAGGWRPRYPLRPSAAWLALVPLGLAAYCGFLAVAEGDPGAAFSAQDAWMREFAGPLVGAWDGALAAWDGLRQLVSLSRDPVYFEVAAGDPFSVAGHNLTLFAFLVLAVIATVGVLRRLPLAYGAWCVAMLALPLSFPVVTQPLMSLPRFVAVLFPFFMWLALWARERRVERWALGVSAAGLAAFSAQFACWVWIA